MEVEDYGRSIEIPVGTEFWHIVNGTKFSYVFAELKRFQEDRLLNKQEFNLKVATMNILEELFEAHGIGDNKERELVRSLYDELELIIEDLSTDKTYCNDKGFTCSIPTIEDQIDAFCDIQVFADGEIGKLGYNNEKCMSEVAREINSRTGEIIDGKFTKYKTPEAIAKWYKASFDNCKAI